MTLGVGAVAKGPMARREREGVGAEGGRGSLYEYTL
jgi:hypothetical protein